MDIGRAVKMLRSQRGLTQEDLEAKSRLGNTLLSVLETGRGNPTLNTLVKLASALDVPPILLLFAASDAADLEGLPQAVVDRLSGLVWQMNETIK